MSTVIVIPLIIMVEHYRDIGENGLAWNINRGKEYRKIQRNIENKEHETGILK
jgi:hypothetical protein